MKKNIIFISIVCALIVALYVCKTTQTQSIPKETEITASDRCNGVGNTIVPTDTTASDEWMRYINDQYQFSFEFPHKTLCIGEPLSGHADATFRNNLEVAISAGIIQDAADVDGPKYIEPTLEWYINLHSSHDGFGIDREFTINGQDAIEFHDPVNLTGGEYTNIPTRTIAVIKDKVLYTISVQIADKETVDRILHSFKLNRVKNSL
jgi:hypothetical protein